MSAEDSGMPSEASFARLALAEHASMLADAAYHLIPTTRDRDARQGEYVAAAAPLVAAARRLLELAVMFERIKGTSWEQVGIDLSISRQAAHERFGQAERDFRERFLRAWLQPARADEVLVSADRLTHMADRLRTYIASRRDPDDQSATIQLEPMSDLERSTLIARASAMLKALATDQQISDSDRHEMELGLCRRKIELYEDLAAQDSENTELREALAGARARLAELRSS
ncbi:hypothetical protein [Nonomuraea africana]|uniref:Sigma-70 family RNA polymerase sigma factor n=1 Tax=Nonomuraea africana TaxID=46171 RepID=A0ABR9KD80_9ACTN|nr:hypothetical protein [Nonomuraea africana]MBE1559969.1 hypothetical protein [Nonomuraea africana]